MSVLGDQVVQSGSKVMPDLIRFDFTHPSSLTPEQIEAVEDWVNNAIYTNKKVTAEERSYNQAIESRAMALFSERYPETVRVIDIPELSREICGGTHVSNTNSIVTFKILSESSVSLGKRRIEAVVGNSALRFLHKSDKTLREISRKLNTQPSELFSRIQYFMKERTEMKTALNLMKKKVVSGETEIQDKHSGIPEAIFNGLYNDVELVVYEFLGTEVDKDFLRKKSNIFREKNPDKFHVLIHKDDVVGALQIEGLNCGEILQKILGQIGGKGGGGKNFGEGKIFTKNAEEWKLKIKSLLK